MTSVIPIATRSIGALLMTRSRRLPPLKNEGAFAPTMISRTIKAAAADTSRLYLPMAIIYLIPQCNGQNSVLCRTFSFHDFGNCAIPHYCDAVAHTEYFGQF